MMACEKVMRTFVEDQENRLMGEDKLPVHSYKRSTGVGGNLL